MAKKKATISHCSQCEYSKPRWVEAGCIYVTECSKMSNDKCFLYYTIDEEMGCDDKEPYSTPIPNNCPLEDAV